MQRLQRLIGRSDQLRGGLSDGPEVTPDKEWHYFCVLSPAVKAVVNFNLTRDTSPDRPAAAQVARLIVLVHEAGHGWDGDVDSVPLRDVEARRGEVGMRLGSSTLRFDPTGFKLSVALARRPLTAHLSLEPRSLPLLARADALLGAGRAGWLVLPRLEATGTIVAHRRTYRLERAPAYHDHNWGSWRWGDDVAWQWGVGLPSGGDGPWTVVFEHLTDRARSRTMELTMGLWRGGELHRLFRHHEVAVEPAGYASVGPILKVPRIMAMVAPERTTDVPKRLVVTAEAGRDRVRMAFEAEDAAQIVVPNQTDLGVTVINEVQGSVDLEGRVKGLRVASAGAGLCEFLT